MHGRGKTATAPASDAAQHGDGRATPLPTRWCCVQFFFFLVSQLTPTRLRLRLIHAKLGRFRPTRVVLGKTAETHWFWRRTSRFRPKLKKKKGRFEVWGWRERVLVCEIERKQVKYILICFWNQERGNEQKELFFFFKRNLNLKELRERSKSV